MSTLNLTTSRNKQSSTYSIYKPTRIGSTKQKDLHGMNVLCVELLYRLRYTSGASNGTKQVANVYPFLTFHFDTAYLGVIIYFAYKRSVLCVDVVRLFFVHTIVSFLTDSRKHFGGYPFAECLRFGLARLEDEGV